MYTRSYKWKDPATGSEGIKEFSSADSEVFSPDSLACRRIKDEAARALVAYWNHKQQNGWQYYLLDTSTGYQ